MYVQRLAEEGLHERLEQLFLELLGPSYPLPSQSPEKAGNGIRLSRTLSKFRRWENTVAGLDKRKLLREVLEVTGRFRELQALNVQYDSVLKDLEEHDEMIID
jgi:hypothetical protein